MPQKPTNSTTPATPFSKRMVNRSLCAVCGLMMKPKTLAGDGTAALLISA